MLLWHHRKKKTNGTFQDSQKKRLTFFFFLRLTFTPSTETTMLTFFFLMFFTLNSYCREKTSNAGLWTCRWSMWINVQIWPFLSTYGNSWLITKKKRLCAAFWSVMIFFRLKATCKQKKKQGENYAKVWNVIDESIAKLSETILSPHNQSQLNSSSIFHMNNEEYCHSNRQHS